jgi:hypothetical protein
MVPLRQITLVLLKSTDNEKNINKLINIEYKKMKYFNGSVDRVYC